MCVCHPRSAPVKRKASPQRSLRQLHPTTWPQTTRLPITLCHISDFFVFLCAYLLSFSSVFTAPSWLAMVKLPYPHPHPTSACRSLSRATLVKQADLCCEQLFHTEHVLWSLTGGIPPTPNGSGVRAALTNNKLEQGEGKQQQSLRFPLQRALFLDRKIGQVRGEQSGGAGWGGFKGGTEGE